MPPLSPLLLLLEFVRADQGGDPFAFRFAAQDYLLRTPGGGFENANFPWEAKFVADLEAIRRSHRDPVIVQRVGEVLRQFLSQLGWAQHESHILQAIREARPVVITIRSSAAELYALPWELLALKSSGQQLGGLPGVLIRYEWPDVPPSPASGAAPEGGRILLAWSAAAGPVPTADHLRVLSLACQSGFHPFDAQKDVLGHASCQSLSQALKTAKQDAPKVGPHSSASMDWVLERVSDLSPDGSRVATGDSKGHVKLWDVASGKIIINSRAGGYDKRSFSGIPKVEEIRFSPTGRHFVSAGTGDWVELWDGVDGYLLGHLSDHEQGATDVAWSSDGKLIVTAGMDGVARLWDLKRTLLAQLKGSDRGLSSVAFSADDQLIVSAGWDAVARIWEVKEGRLLLEVKGARSAISRAAFSPDGRRLVTESGDNVVRLWDIHPEERSPAQIDRLLRCQLDMYLKGSVVVLGAEDKTGCDNPSLASK